MSHDSSKENASISPDDTAELPKITPNQVVASQDDSATSSESETNAASQEATIERPMIDLESRPLADCDQGRTERLAWGSRSDVGLLRGHNEDSYLCRAPLFAVSDGMGGEAAGEVASSIAIHMLAKCAPSQPDDTALGAAVEAANAAVMDAPEKGRGRQGMGCTLTAALISHNHMAIAHVGDSRIYVLHKGSMVRITHDHSYVEELVDAGAITADEARVHPKRSVITRALGSDPNMYADHFMLEVEAGERVILCSDGLSSMVGDAEIEEICVTSPTPQECADALVSAALIEGGRDNVTVVVVDILDDGKEVRRKKRLHRNIALWSSVAAALLIFSFLACFITYSNTYYLAPIGQNIGIYQGFQQSALGIPLSHLVAPTEVKIGDLSSSAQQNILTGLYVPSVDAAYSAVNAYENEIAAKKEQEAAEAAAAQGAAQAEQNAETSNSEASPTDPNAVVLSAEPEEGGSVAPEQGGAQSEQDEAQSETTLPSVLANPAATVQGGEQ